MYQVLWSTSQSQKGHSAEELLWQYMVEIQQKQLQPYELFYETMVAKIPVCTVTTLCAGWSRVSFTAGAGEVALLQNVQTSSGVHKAYSTHTKDFSSGGVKQSGHQVYHSLSSSADVNSKSNYTSTHPQKPLRYEHGWIYPYPPFKRWWFLPTIPPSKKDKTYNTLRQLTFRIDAFIQLSTNFPTSRIP